MHCILARLKNLNFVRMKRVIILALALLGFAACDNDFKVGADYKEVSIIYGLLDEGDESEDHYIKILKGFFSETEDNLVLATNKDSIYFSDLDVKVEELNNGTVTNSFTCSRVDLYSLPTPIKKQNGVFLDSPNYAYTFNAKLNPDREYRLTVKNNISGKIITGLTSVIATDAVNFEVFRPFTAFDRLDFADGNSSYNFIWKAPEGAELFDVMLRFYYDEKDLINNTTEKKSVDLPLGSFIPRTGNTITYAVENSTFYSLLTSSIGAADINTTRLVDTAELFFIAGDSTIQQYVDVNNAQGGLTNDQIKPVYTNLVGNDVLGIFGSRATNRLGFVNFTDPTYDSIIGGSFTRNLNFTGRSVD